VQSAGSVSENESDSKIEKLVDKEVLFLQRFDTYVLENLELSDLRIHVIADHFHMSERSLHRKLNAVAGLSPKQYVMSLRMREAEKRLIATRDAVNTIALCVGFTDAAHFSRAFKTHNQLTPLEYRKQHSDS
jgi:AraC-like DNA-binding protein